MSPIGDSPASKPISVGFDASSLETVVVDLGCAPHEGDFSIERLIDRYNPLCLWGFDPLLVNDEDTRHKGTWVYLSKKVAWIGEGTMKMGIGGRTLLNATLMEEKKHEGEWGEEVEVEFFDFGDWLQDVKDEERLIVKMNIEGAEFPLLENLHERGLDALIDLLHVSWHDDRMQGAFPARRQHLEEVLRCPIEPWELW